MVSSAVDTGESIRAEFTITKEEYLRAVRSLLIRNIQVRVMLGLGAALIILGILLATGGSDPFGIPGGRFILFAYGVFCLLYVGLRYLIQPRQIYNKIPVLQAPQTWEFRETGVLVVAESGLSDVKWAGYKRAWIDREYLVLIATGFQVFPRRALRDRADLERLEAMVRRHLPVGGHS
jgi:hypothetical protein